MCQGWPSGALDASTRGLRAPLHHGHINGEVANRRSRTGQAGAVLRCLRCRRQLGIGLQTPLLIPADHDVGSGGRTLGKHSHHHVCPTCSFGLTCGHLHRGLMLAMSWTDNSLAPAIVELSVGSPPAGRVLASSPAVAGMELFGGWATAQASSSRSIVPSRSSTPVVVVTRCRSTMRDNSRRRRSKPGCRSAVVRAAGNFSCRRRAMPAGDVLDHSSSSGWVDVRARRYCDTNTKIHTNQRNRH